MTAVEPYKDHKELSEVLEFLKQKGDKYYVLAMFAVKTGAFLVDAVNTLVSDVSDCVSYTNPKSGVSFAFDADFSSYMRTYIDSLSPGAVYLFPGKNDCTAHAAMPSISKQFATYSERAGIPLSYLRFQKTFALNYFLKYGTLVGSNLCYPGRGEKVVCNYLCITPTQYHQIIKRQTVLDLTDRTLDIENIKRSKERFNEVIDDYIAYLNAGKYDADYETSTSRFLQQHNTLILNYQKRTARRDK